MTFETLTQDSNRTSGDVSSNVFYVSKEFCYVLDWVVLV